MKDVIELLNRKFKPISIFLYGSRAGKNFLKKSDFEIGVLFSKENYNSRGEIKKVITNKKFNIYPFEYNSFIKGQLDTPFQKSIYLHELIIGGKTISGEKIIENMTPPKIRIVDLLQDLRFNIGYAFASMHSYRNGDKYTASYEFYKSCLYGLRNFEILKLKRFPANLSDIYKLSKRIDIGEYKKVVSNAYKLRLGKIKLQEKDLFKNISFLNYFIEPILLESFKKEGNRILIK